ncbi:MAG: AAA family ATPase [Kiloniellaceae bacterium]
MVNKRIHITGASGAGTTTLGSALAARLSVAHFDSDDFYWKPSDPPFQESRCAADRLELMRPLLEGTDSWVLSGALEGWGDSLVPFFDLAVFLTVPTEIRLLRLRARETKRFGERAISQGGPMFPRYRDLLGWARSYDTAGVDRRSRKLHQVWLAGLSCDVLRLNGVAPVDRQVRQILRAISAKPRG